MVDKAKAATEVFYEALLELLPPQPRATVVPEYAGDAEGVHVPEASAGAKAPVKPAPATEAAPSGNAKPTTAGSAAGQQQQQQQSTQASPLVQEPTASPAEKQTGDRSQADKEPKEKREHAAGTTGLSQRSSPEGGVEAQAKQQAFSPEGAGLGSLAPPAAAGTPVGATETRSVHEGARRGDRVAPPPSSDKNASAAMSTGEGLARPAGGSEAALGAVKPASSLAAVGADATALLPNASASSIVPAIGAGLSGSGQAPSPIGTVGDAADSGGVPAAQPGAPTSSSPASTVSVADASAGGGSGKIPGGAPLLPPPPPADNAPDRPAADKAPPRSGVEASRGAEGGSGGQAVGGAQAPTTKVSGGEVKDTKDVVRVGVMAAAAAAVTAINAAVAAGPAGIGAGGKPARTTSGAGDLLTYLTRFRREIYWKASRWNDR